MKVQIYTVSTTEGAPDRLYATCWLDESGRVVCDPPSAISFLIPDLTIYYADRAVHIDDGHAFLEALHDYPWGSYTYTKLVEK